MKHQCPAPVVLGSPDDENTTHLSVSVICKWRGVPTNTFAMWRTARDFPKPVYVYGCFLYPRAEVAAWLSQRRGKNKERTVRSRHHQHHHSKPVEKTRKNKRLRPRADMGSERVATA